MLSAWDAVVKFIKFLPSETLNSSVEYTEIRGDDNMQAIRVLNFTAGPCGSYCQFIW